STSDVPNGVVNILTGRTAELAPWLAAHADVNAVDLTGAPEESRPDLERRAAGTVKRVLRARTTELDWTNPPGTARIRAFLETKTVWHPTGACSTSDPYLGTRAAVRRTIDRFSN